MYGHLVIQPQPQQQQQPQQPQQPFYSQSQPQTNNAIPTPSTPSRNVSTNSNSTFQSVGDAFGSLVEVEDAPLTPLGDMSMPQYNASPVTAASASVGDAFSGMGEATNAPLPALGGTTPRSSTSLRPSVTTASVPNTPNPTILYTTPTSTRAPPVARTPGGSSTGGFGFWSLGASSVADRAKTIATSTPKQPLPTSILATVSDDDEDDFCDFGSANPPPPIPSMPPTDTTNNESSFANTSNETTNVASSPPKQNRFSFYTPDDTPALAAGTIGTELQTSNTAPVVSVSDAFGDMLPVADAPLPSLDAFGNTTANQETSNADGGFGDFEAAANDDESEEEDDDFGNFEQAAPTDNADKDLFGFSDTPQPESSLGMAPTAQSALSISDAFGDMAIQQDAPLPSLGDFATAASAAPTTANDNGDDDFGDFEDAPAQPTSAIVPESTEDEDDFGDFGGAPATTEATARPAQQPVSILDAFGDMPAQPDAPLPSLGDFGTSNIETTASDDNDNDDFGHFGDVAPTTTVEPEPAIMDAFGDMPAQPDAPLPSLGAFGASNIGTTANDDNDDDDFGDFEDAAPTTTVEPAPTIMDAFGDMPAQPDAPLPSLGAFGTSNIKTTASEDNDDDDFGDFEDAAPTTTVEPEPTIMDAFGDIPAQPDAPLPSLGDFGASNTETQSHDDDDFGDFADAAPATVVESEPAPLVRSVSIDDAFGDFAAPEDAPLPSLEQFGATSTTVAPPMPAEQEESDDDFGDFSGTAPPSDPLPSENDQNDEFGGFAQAESTVEEPPEAPAVPPAPLSSISDDPLADMPTNDAPLPSLAVLSSSNQPSESQSPETEDSDDEFGGFESSAVSQSIDSTVPVSDSNLMDFGAPSTTDLSSDTFGDFGVADAPLPSLPNTTASSTAEEPDLFGDFAPSGQNESTPAQTSADDGAEDLLDIFGTQPTQNNAVDEDEFGDFGAAEPQPETTTTGDEAFGAFGTADAINDAPAQQNVQEDIFGDFGNAPVKPSADDDDDFGDFGSTPTQVADAATPSAQEDDFGDFGSAPVVDPSVEDQDDFGDFGSAEPPAPVETTIQPADDDFGDFGTAQVRETTDENDFGDFGSAEPAASSDEKDDFGDFGSVPMPQDDDFGDFGSANPATPVQTAEENDFGDFGSAKIVPEPQVQDDFGDFASVEPATSTGQNADDFGAFSSSPTEEPAKDAPNSDEDLFGAFGSAEVTHEQPAASTESAQQFGEFEKEPAQVNDDEFGGFGSAEFSSPPQVEQTTATSAVDAEDDSDFGDFTVVDAPQATKSETEDDFGDFSGVQDSSPPVPQSQQEDGDDWGDFEAVSAPPPEDAMGELRNRIRSLALQLPDCVLRKAGVSGDHVDLGEAFEIMVETNSAANEKRAQRCIQVLESLTSSKNSKLASTVWMQIFDVVIEELELAKSLLAEASISFSSNWNEIKIPLATMVQGLAEYMRVARSIVASIGDMLLVDESAMLTVDTWASTWSSLSLLEKALSCETRWKEVDQLVKKTPIGSVPTPTLQEIRSEASTLDSALVLCHLTLQPLHKKLKNTTKAEVSFQGKCFMACSANVLANRCPSLI